MLASPVAFIQAAQRTTLENLADISTIIIAVVILVLLGALILAVLELKKGQKKLMSFIDSLRGDLAPAINNVREISSNLAGVSEMVNSRVQSVDDTLNVANDRLRNSVELAYRRVRHFDALLEVAQEEAESLFFNAASAVRGVRHGAESIVGGKRSRRRRAERMRARYLETEDDEEDTDQVDADHNGGGRHTLDDGEPEQLWDDDFERVIDVEDARDPAHPLTSTEQGPTIHRRRPRTTGSR
jgi:uncharacterized protein YoxC